MVEVYVNNLRSLLESAEPQSIEMADIECRHFFSGAAAYVDGRIFMTLTPVGLALKLPQEARTELLEHGATTLRYFPNAPIKKDYVVVPENLIRDVDALRHWIDTSISYCRVEATA